jgi:hypothetical protein
VKDGAEVLRTAERKDWPGYWGAPSLTTAAIGEELMDRFAELGVTLALAALAGEDLSALPVFPESPTPTPEMKALVESLRERYAQRNRGHRGLAPRPRAKVARREGDGSACPAAFRVKAAPVPGERLSPRASVR